MLGKPEGCFPPARYSLCPESQAPDIGLATGVCPGNPLYDSLCYRCNHPSFRTYRRLRPPFRLHVRNYMPPTSCNRLGGFPLPDRSVAAAVGEHGIVASLAQLFGAPEPPRSRRIELGSGLCIRHGYVRGICLARA